MILSLTLMLVKQFYGVNAVIFNAQQIFGNIIELMELWWLLLYSYIGSFQVVTTFLASCK